MPSSIQLVHKDKTVTGSFMMNGDQAKINGTAQKIQWYTEGKTLFFVDPSTEQKEAITFYAEQNRMMLTGKKSKKLYQRVDY